MGKILDIKDKVINNWVVLELDRVEKHKAYWKCRCKCGYERVLCLHDLKVRIKQCKNCVNKDRIENLIGSKFNKWNVLEIKGKNKWGNYQWLCECSCIHKTRKIITSSVLKRNKSTCCGRCTSNSKYFQEISGVFWTFLKRGAKQRNLDFIISKEYIWNLFIQQNRKCVFTGIKLKFSSLSERYDGTASLDRIDSTKGYIEGNVQWVWKRINIMKSNLLDKEFIEICKMVAEYNSENCS